MLLTTNEPSVYVPTARSRVRVWLPIRAEFRAELPTELRAELRADLHVKKNKINYKMISDPQSSGLSSLKGDAKPGGLPLTRGGCAAVALQLASWFLF